LFLLVDESIQTTRSDLAPTVLPGSPATDFPEILDFFSIFLHVKNSIQFGTRCKFKSGCLKRPPGVRLNHCLFECPIDFEQEIGCVLVIIER
jgi:hypothetical protein